MKLYLVFHISLLKKYNPDNKFNRYQSSSVIIISDNKEEYEVENILDKRIHYHKSQYLVK